jgi:hypothetical protein
MGGIYEYVVEMGLVAVICIPSFRKIGSGIQKLMVGGYTDIQSGLRSHKKIL